MTQYGGKISKSSVVTVTARISAAAYRGLIAAADEAGVQRKELLSQLLEKTFTKVDDRVQTNKFDWKKWAEYKD